MLSLLFQSPLFFLIFAAALTTALTIHEFAHAFVADRLGDPTARLQDRLTLNPIKHLDPIGTAMLLFTGFGWGKPVPFDPYNLKNPRKDSALIALAGPASNLLFALVLAILYQVFGLTTYLPIFLALISLNVTLAVFNLVPIHPLDGGKIIIGFLPLDLAREWQGIMNRYGILILIFMLFPFGNSASPVSYLISPIIDGVVKLLLFR